MTYRGRVKDGVIVLEDQVDLPEGAEVRVDLEVQGSGPVLDEQGQTLGQKLLKYAGKAEGLPPDAARHHDHYLYGTARE